MSSVETYLWARVRTGLFFLTRFYVLPIPHAFTDAFLEQAVSYQQFVDNPALIDDPHLVVKIGNKYVPPEGRPAGHVMMAFRFQLFKFGDLDSRP